MGKRKNSDAPASSSLRWTTRMDRVLIVALLNEVACGNRVDGQSTSHAYENIVEESSEKFNLPLTKENLNNRLKNIKSNFGEVFLFGASGWGWNEVTEMFENEDEVWDTLLEKKREAQKWKNTPFHHFDLLVKLFSKDRPSGKNATTANEKRIRMNSTLGEADESTVDARTGEDTADSKKRKKKATDDILWEEILTVRAGLDNIAQALLEENEVIAKGRPQFYTTQEVHEELTRMELDVITRRKAYRFLSAKQARVRELFGCPLKERWEYLMEIMMDDGF